MTNANETSANAVRNSRPRRVLVLTSIALIGVAAGGAAVWAQSGGSSATSTQPSTTMAPVASSSTTAVVATTTTVVTHAEHEVAQNVGTGTVHAEHSDDDTAGTTLCDGWIEHADLGGHHAAMTIHDATDGAEPTAQDCANARTFYDSVTAGIAQYASLDAAKAAGYEARERSTETGAFRHYFMKAGVRDVLDVDKPEGLMFHTHPVTGVVTLVGAVFSERTDGLPQPGGPLTTWHDHHDASMCSATDPGCGSGAPRMLHVWTFASAIDPFAMDLPHAVGQHGSRKSFDPNS